MGRSGSCRDSWHYRDGRLVVARSAYSHRRRQCSRRFGCGHYQRRSSKPHAHPIGRRRRRWRKSATNPGLTEELEEEVESLGPQLANSLPSLQQVVDSGPGEWLADFQAGANTSPEANEYEARVAEKIAEGFGYYIDTVQFDGYIGKTLIEAKYWLADGRVVTALQERNYGQALRLSIKLKGNSL